MAARPDEINRDHGPARTLRFPADPAHARSAEMSPGDLKSGGLRAVRVRVSPPALHTSAANQPDRASVLATPTRPNWQGDSESGSGNGISSRFPRTRRRDPTRSTETERGRPRRAETSRRLAITTNAFMVSRASAVGCQPLREVPSLRRRGSISFRWSRLSVAAAVRARALVTTTTGACHADHGSILVGYRSARGRVVLSFDLGVQGDGQTRAACAEGTWSRRARRRARSTEQAMLHRAA